MSSVLKAVFEELDNSNYHCPYVPLIYGGIISPTTFEDIEQCGDTTFKLYFSRGAKLGKKSQEAFDWIEDNIPKNIRLWTYCFDIECEEVCVGLKLDIKDRKLCALFKLLWL